MQEEETSKRKERKGRGQGEQTLWDQALSVTWVLPRQADCPFLLDLLNRKR